MRERKAIFHAFLFSLKVSFWLRRTLHLSVRLSCEGLIVSVVQRSGLSAARQELLWEWAELVLAVASGLAVVLAGMPAVAAVVAAQPKLVPSLLRRQALILFLSSSGTSLRHYFLNLRYSFRRDSPHVDDFSFRFYQVFFEISSPCVFPQQKSGGTFGGKSS
jgi:hypothetical protein